MSETLNLQDQLGWLDSALRRSQSDITPDPLEAQGYAQWAYEIATMKEVRSVRPLAASTAAVKIGFHMARIGMLESDVTGWFTVSENILQAARNNATFDQREVARAKVDHCLLYGRSLGALALKNELGITRKVGENAAGQLTQARTAFGRCEVTLAELRLPKAPYDRYQTMASYYHSVVESIAADGTTGKAIALAVKGIRSALWADREKQPMPAHLKFVAKHAVKKNALALVFALSKPADRFIGKTRRRIAHRIIT